MAGERRDAQRVGRRRLHVRAVRGDHRHEHPGVSEALARDGARRHPVVMGRLVHDPRRERQQHSHEGDVRKVDQLRRHLGSDQAERVIFHQSRRERRRRPSLRRRVRGLATVCRRQ